MNHPSFRPTLHINRFLEGAAPGIPEVIHPLEFAPAARRLNQNAVLVGQQLWSLPVPSDILAKAAASAGTDILLFRDMKDRDPKRSVRCDLLIHIDSHPLVLRDLIPHRDMNSPPAFLSADRGIFFVLGTSGIELTSRTSLPAAGECVDGIEFAARLLLGRPILRSVA